MTEQTKQQTTQTANNLPITVIANDSRKLDFDKDRYLLEGIDFERYLKNPVICLNHERSELPIGKATKIWIENDMLMCDIEIYKSDIDSEHSQLCATIQDMVEKGIVKGISITTRDIEAYPNEYGGYDIFRCELIEISIVTIPNNENSLIQK